MGESNMQWVMLIVTLVVILGSVLTAILLKRREKHKNQEGKSDDESPRENIIIHKEGEPIPQYEVKINKSDDDDSKEYGHAILTFVDIWRILWIILAILGLLLFINDAITGTIYLTMLIGQPLSMILIYGIGRGLVLLSQIRNELRKMNKK
nr:MAG TPA: Melibiose carrier protein permease, melibiose/Na+ symport, membrane.35A [Caudoviricetes sp.]